MFSLGGVGQGLFIYVLWRKSYVNNSLMGLESTAWGLLEPDDNSERQKASLHLFLLSSHSTEIGT